MRLADLGEDHGRYRSAGKRLATVVAQCDEYSAAFKSLEDRAKELQRGGYLGTEDAKVYTKDGAPGFEINYRWKTFRFFWEAIGVDNEPMGQLVLLESELDDQLKTKWRRLFGLRFGRNGRIDPSQIPDDAKGLRLGDAEDNYHILMQLILLGLTGKPLR